MVTGIDPCHYCSSSSLLTLTTFLVNIIIPTISGMGLGERGRDGGTIVVFFEDKEKRDFLSFAARV
jgi:hypothetical protein